MVLGALERGGKVRATVIPDRTRATLHGYVKDNVEPGATLYTDSLGSYTGLQYLLDPPPDGRTPFERFEDVLRKVVTVPKAAVDVERERRDRRS